MKAAVLEAGVGMGNTSAPPPGWATPRETGEDPSVCLGDHGAKALPGSWVTWEVADTGTFWQGKNGPASRWVP